jgi:hypothetical protein
MNKNQAPCLLQDNQ